MSDDSSARALAAAEALGLAHTVTRHGPVRSLEEAAAARGVEPHAAREDDGGAGLPTTTTVFVLVPGDREIAWPKLRALLGVNRLSMPSADAALRGHRLRARHHHAAGQHHACRSSRTPRCHGPVSLGGGAPGVALTVDAASSWPPLAPTVADVTEPRG